MAIDTATADVSIRMGPSMLEIGKMISQKAKAVNDGAMVASTTVCGRKANLTASVS